MKTYASIQELISTIDADDLVDLYAEMVRVNHYDPFTTPPQIVNLQEIGVTERFLRDMIVNTMNAG